MEYEKKPKIVQSKVSILSCIAMLVSPIFNIDSLLEIESLSEYFDHIDI